MIIGKYFREINGYLPVLVFKMKMNKKVITEKCQFTAVQRYRK